MSSNYNPIERSLAKILSSFPGVKSAIKKNYQGINAILYKKNYSYSSNYNLRSMNAEGETFFGYYDRSPESPNGDFLLFYNSNFSTHQLPNPSKPIDLVLYDLDSKTIKKKYQVFAYNWQQGSKAQWLTSDKFIFNNFSEDNGFYSVIVDTKVKKEEKIDFPIYDCFQDIYGLSLSFERLNALRPDYGYRNMDQLNLPSYEADGVYKIDFKTNTSKLIITLERLINFEPKPEMKEAEHKVNHLMISPDGEKFIFLHRYLNKGKRYDRLFLCDKNGNYLRVLSDQQMVSHCCWNGNNHVVGYLRDFETGDKYYCIDIRTLEKVPIGSDSLNKLGDGHPTILNGVMVTDTYPNKSRMKDLLLFDLNQKSMKKLGEFYESLRYYGETRCDLHPRFNFLGNKVYFDSVHEGKRRLYWLDINE